jgi:hypothetical protein
MEYSTSMARVGESTQLPRLHYGWRKPVALIPGTTDKNMDNDEYLEIDNEQRLFYRYHLLTRRLHKLLIGAV